MVIKNDTAYLSAQEIVALLSAVEIDSDGEGKATIEMDGKEVRLYIKYEPVERRSIMCTYGCSTLYDVETIGWEKPSDIEIEVSEYYDVADETLQMAQEIADKQFDYIEV